MLITPEEIHQIHNKFKTCTPIFIALSDEYRQKIILDIADAGTTGINVTDLAANSTLSRPAISHHLKVLRDSGLIRPFKIGTQIFYKLNLKENFSEVEDLCDSVRKILKIYDTLEQKE